MKKTFLLNIIYLLFSIMFLLVTHCNTFFNLKTLSHFSIKVDVKTFLKSDALKTPNSCFRVGMFSTTTRSLAVKVHIFWENHKI